MKLLKIRILGILKLVLLFNFQVIQASPIIVSSDRLILKIGDQVYSLSDMKYQVRNLKALHCIYDGGVIVRYFGKEFIRQLDEFVNDYPESPQNRESYFKNKEPLLKQVRLLFKGIKYAEDQKLMLTETVEGLIRESASLNKCDSSVLKENSLKANFISLLRLELYLRSRYSSTNMKSKAENYKILNESMNLFIESIDKQLPHEFFR
jgi:hypothetical protein